MRRLAPALILMSLLGVRAACGSTNLISDPSFEDNPPGTPVGGTVIFTATDIWTIDVASIRSAEKGIVPHDGSQMLRFTLTTCCFDDVYQLLDRAALPDGIELTAHVNATQVHDFRINILAYDECCLPLDVSSWDETAGAAELTSDDDVETWERITLRYAVPQAASFIAVGVNSNVDGAAAYVDSVSLIGVSLCPADLDGDDAVGFGDLTLLLGNWGPCGADCPADLDGDDAVGFGDLTMLLGNWGPCGV